MFQGGNSGVGTALLLLGGAVFMKPRDLLVISRVAGRLCGSAIFALRGVRKAFAETVASEAATDDLKGMRDSVFSSFKQIEDISRTVSREVAEASPVASLRAATTFKPKRNSQALGNTAKSAPLPSDNSSALPAGEKRRPVGLSSLSGTGHESSGAGIIARVIEEAAFAKQHSRIVGSSNDFEPRK